MLKHYTSIFKNHLICCPAGNCQFHEYRFETDNPAQQAAIERDPFYGTKIHCIDEIREVTEIPPDAMDEEGEDEGFGDD